MERSSDVLFVNDHYYVEVEVWRTPVRSNGYDYTEGYSVTNRETEITEFRMPQLPEAIAAAEQLDIAMTTKSWEWQRRGGSRDSGPDINPDGSTSEDTR